MCTVTKATLAVKLKCPATQGNRIRTEAHQTKTKTFATCLVLALLLKVVMGGIDRGETGQGG